MTAQHWCPREKNCMWANPRTKYLGERRYDAYKHFLLDRFAIEHLLTSEPSASVTTIMSFSRQ